MSTCNCHGGPNCCFTRNQRPGAYASIPENDMPGNFEPHPKFSEPLSITNKKTMPLEETKCIKEIRSELKENEELIYFNTRAHIREMQELKDMLIKLEQEIYDLREKAGPQ